MLSSLDLDFWKAAIPVICVLSLPISLITGSSVLRSFAAAIVVYLLIVVTKLHLITPL